MKTKKTNKKTLYTVREPGNSYWWRGANKREAERQLKLARAAGLHRAIIVQE